MPADNERPTVLCVDDQETGLTIRKLFLESQGYQVLTAGSGSEGLEKLREREVDALVLDYRMPEMDGGEMAAIVSRENPELPIIMLSGYIHELPASLQKKVAAFIIKGSPPSALLEALEKALGGVPPKQPQQPDVMQQSHQHAGQVREHVEKARAHLGEAKKVVSMNLEARRRRRKSTG